MSTPPINLKNNTTSLNTNTEGKKQFNVSKFGRQQQSIQTKKPRLQFSDSDYIPYYENEIQRSIRYFSSTCGYYECARALENYLHHLRRYKKGHLQRPPKYPNLCALLPEPSNKYKRPAMYQGIGSVASPRTFVISQSTKIPSKYEIVKPIEKEPTLLHEVPEEIITIIK